MISPLFITVGMLTLSNIFMTFAWYGHLRYFSGRIWIIEQPEYCII
ncbi:MULTISPECIES: DMT family protein [Pectobacterium]|nr:DMT family protein [Pectobacterium brasiliense]